MHFITEKDQPVVLYQSSVSAQQVKMDESLVLQRLSEPGLQMHIGERGFELELVERPPGRKRL